MKTIKLIAIDMDGTLLTRDKQISSEDRQTLQEAAQIGVKIVLCTGRPKSGIEPYLSQLDLPNQEYAIGNNGCLTFDSRDWQILDLVQTPFQHIESLAELLADFPKLNLVLFTPEGNYVLGAQINAQTRRDAEIELSKLYHTDLTSFKKQKIPVLVPIFMGPTEELDRFQTLYQETLRADFNPTRSLDYAFEALPKGVSKASALQNLARQLDIHPSQIMAIGDGNNDLEMLAYAGLSVAMANASKVVKDAADYLTDSNEASGVAKAIRRHVLVQNPDR